MKSIRRLGDTLLAFIILLGPLGIDKITGGPLFGESNAWLFLIGVVLGVTQGIGLLTPTVAQEFNECLSLKQTHFLRGLGILTLLVFYGIAFFIPDDAGKCYFISSFIWAANLTGISLYCIYAATEPFVRRNRSD